MEEHREKLKNDTQKKWDDFKEENHRNEDCFKVCMCYT